MISKTGKCKMGKREIKGRDMQENRTIDDNRRPQDDVAGALRAHIDKGGKYLFPRPETKCVLRDGSFRDFAARYESARPANVGR